jgi:hypothetical protein
MAVADCFQKMTLFKSGYTGARMEVVGVCRLALKAAKRPSHTASEWENHRRWDMHTCNKLAKNVGHRCIVVSAPCGPLGVKRLERSVELEVVVK